MSKVGRNKPKPVTQTHEHKSNELRAPMRAMLERPEASPQSRGLGLDRSHCRNLSSTGRKALRSPGASGPKGTPASWRHVLLPQGGTGLLRGRQMEQLPGEMSFFRPQLNRLGRAMKRPTHRMCD